MAKKKVAPKVKSKKLSKYHKKIVVNATFEELLKAVVAPVKPKSRGKG